MKCFLVFAMLLNFFSVEDRKMKPNIMGSYCVMSMNDDNVLDYQNREHIQSVASISKVMTALVAIEEGNLKDKIVVDDIIDQAEGSMLYLKKGDQYTLEDLLYGLLLRSGNDAAVLIADKVAGSITSFVSKMNVKAKEMGLYHTQFNNPSGLDEKEGNTSTSCDMALLTSYAMKNKTFRKISGSLTYSPKKSIVWKNKNKFLSFYAHATGGKTGFTKKARRTLITTSKKEDMEIVVVTLNATNDFRFHATLHDQMYAKYRVKKVINQGLYKVADTMIKVKNPIYQTITKEEEDSITIKGKKTKANYQITVHYRDQERMYKANYE